MKNFKLDLIESTFKTEDSLYLACNEDRVSLLFTDHGYVRTLFKLATIHIKWAT